MSDPRPKDEFRAMVDVVGKQQIGDVSWVTRPGER